ncbi:DUF1059 domain-containing protein [Rhodococcus sp. X156]|uniref:DUF1059 domain-containing protein n=1 Tax=Rhodococcus sp. X156 TaxID=2499145 RepID=UPI000FDBA685|nr:DUF1059 domain-containing protein [Rhodococcus sp. X156]
MKSFRCGDVVPGCTAAFTGTEDEILAQAARHAARDHGMTSVSPEMVLQVRGAMTPLTA